MPPQNGQSQHSLPDEYLKLLRHLQAVLERERVHDHGINLQGDVSFLRVAVEKVLGYIQPRPNNDNNNNNNNNSGDTPHGTSAQDLMRLANEYTNGQSTFISPSVRRATDVTQYSSITGQTIGAHVLVMDLWVSSTSGRWLKGLWRPSRLSPSRGS